ncbi:zinc finger, CCHC-type containing protein, partial [Tanacetum coccineum]
IVKDMTAKIGKLDKFEGNDFRRWQKKMHFLLTTLKVVYVFSTPMLEFLEDAMLEQTRKRCKWENDDYICRGHILNEDAFSKKFLASNFNNNKMVDSRSVMEQYHELLRILGQFTQHGLNMDETISVSKETLRAEESGKGKGKEIAGSSLVNMIEDGKNKNNNKNNKAKKRKNDDDAFAWWIDSGATCHACKDSCWFHNFHSMQDGSVLHMGDESTKPILGRGNVVLEFSSGKTITLVNVVYVPGLRKNLIYYNNGMFMLNLNKVRNAFSSVWMISSKDVDSFMWHARLGHAHYKYMLPMSKDNLIPEFDIALGKLTYVIFMPLLPWGIRSM